MAPLARKRCSAFLRALEGRHDAAHAIGEWGALVADSAAELGKGAAGVDENCL